MFLISFDRLRFFIVDLKALQLYLDLDKMKKNNCFFFQIETLSIQKKYIFILKEHKII